MEKPRIDPNEWIFSLNDLVELYTSLRKTLFRAAVIGALGAFLLVGIGKVKYKAEAKFKEGVEKSSSATLIKELIGGMAAGSQPQAASVMKSYQVLRPLIEKMGLQISPAPSGWAVVKLARRYQEAWRAEKGLLLNDLDRFVFENVSYENEKQFSFHLLFSDENHFQIYDEKKKNELGRGTLGEAQHLVNPAFSFTIKKVPNSLKQGSYYRFSAQNSNSVAVGLRKQIKIQEDKDNKAIIDISFLDRDRHLATELVNELMRQYQAYLKREFHHIAKEQLAYLELKQTQTMGQMGDLIDQQTTYLKQNLGENGFIGLDQESQTILAPYQEMSKQVLAIEVELGRLSQIEREGNLSSTGGEGALSKEFLHIKQKMQELKEERDFIELSLCQMTESSLQMRKEELQLIRNQRCAIEKMLQEVELGSQISCFDANPDLVLWAKDLTSPEEREDLAEYLENFGRILSMKEKMLHERFYSDHTVPKELEGIDLLSARSLFLEYNSKLDAAEASIRYYTQFKKEIGNPQFDLASLGSVLKDPLCQKIIGEAAQLGLQLKDEKHHTTKEGERWREELSLRRKILIDHLDQLCQVEALNADLIRKKMGGLQSVALDGINRKISVLHEQFYDAIKGRRQALLLEKDLLEKKMGAIRASLAAVVPDKWRFEKWLSIKTEMMEKVMTAMTEVVESKTLSTHLYQVASKPLDIALVPLAPESPKLYLMSCMGAFGSALLTFFFYLVRRLTRGFPASSEKLKSLQIPVLGKISRFCDGPGTEIPTGSDLDLLRNIGLFAEGGKVIALVNGKGPDYSYALAENLGRREAKSVIVRCDFNSKFQKEDSPGILQIWKGEIGELPLRKGSGFDFMMAGGYTRFGAEIIQSPQFKQLIDLLKKNYDWVFLYSKSPLSSAESSIPLHLCDKAVVTVTDEKIEELTPFVDWGYDQSHCRITFITER